LTIMLLLAAASLLLVYAGWSGRNLFGGPDEKGRPAVVPQFFGLA